MSKQYENLLLQPDKLRRHNRQGSFKTRERYYEAMKRFCRFLAEQYRLERLANVAPKHIFAYVYSLQESGKAASTIKGKGGLVRTVPLNDILLDRFRLHLNDTIRGHKLFVPDNRLTHEAIKDFQRFLADHRPLAQDPDSDRPMTFHGLRHTRAAEWYQERIQRGRSPYQARKEVAKLLGHGRDDVTRIYLASLKEEGGGRDG